MPETRKFEPSSHDPIQEAVRAALGETVRPLTPGQAPAKTESSATPPAGVVPPVATLGAFTFTSVPKPKHAAADEDGATD